jgi:hypothetical protein
MLTVTICRVEAVRPSKFSEKSHEGNVIKESQLARESRRMPENGKERPAPRALLFFPSPGCRQAAVSILIIPSLSAKEQELT